VTAKSVIRTQYLAESMFNFHRRIYLGLHLSAHNMLESLGEVDERAWYEGFTN
jgi:hypothetical protein